LICTQKNYNTNGTNDGKTIAIILVARVKCGSCRLSPTTVGSKSTNRLLGTKFPASVSQKKVFRYSVLDLPSDWPRELNK